MRHWFEHNGERMCDGLLHARRCGIMISRNAGRAGLSVSIRRLSGAIIRQIIQQQWMTGPFSLISQIIELGGQAAAEKLLPGVVDEMPWR